MYHVKLNWNFAKGLAIQNKNRSWAFWNDTLPILVSGVLTKREGRTHLHPTPLPTIPLEIGPWPIERRAGTWQKCLNLSPTEETKQQIKLQSDLNEIPAKTKSDEEKEKTLRTHDLWRVRFNERTETHVHTDLVRWCFYNIFLFHVQTQH